MPYYGANCQFASIANLAPDALPFGALSPNLSRVPKTVSKERGIGWAIRKVRKSQGRTLEDVAADAGTDASNLSRVERGVQDAPQVMLKAIATALNVSVSSLWTLAETGSKDPDDTGKLLALSARLDDSGRERVLDFANYILDRQAD